MNLDKITQPFIKEFPGDFSGNLMQRQTPKVLFATIPTEQFDSPELIHFNKELSEDIGLGDLENNSDYDFLFAKNLPSNLQTYATAYAGHQFGNWSGQLGDGRAILAGEITNSKGEKTELQWKGAGATPYSRHADGRAVLRSSVREYLMSEAMHHLGIPTTRALSLAYTSEEVIRDVMYNGNPSAEKGAVIVRTAPSFLRFGHFELLSAQKEIDTLRKLADFTIENYYPEISIHSETKYKELFRHICIKTADLIVEWYRTGFVHGVMNTDNMSVLGLSIDFGPFSMMDEYDLRFTPNTTDLPGRRYAFGKQAEIGQWNLWQLANALHSLINDSAFLESELNSYGTYFWKKHDEMLARKFGLSEVLPSDEEFFTSWQQMMQDLKLDYTLFFTLLESFNETDSVKEYFEPCIYHQFEDKDWDKLETFLQNYSVRKSKDTLTDEERIELMQKTNPKFILRNYLLYNCIEELEKGNTDLFTELWTALKNPYSTIYPKFEVKRPSKFDGTIGCSMLSCSS